jgi:hypothetical protein
VSKVDLNVYIVGKATDNSEAHIRRASEIYGKHGVTFQVRHKDTVPDNKIVSPLDGKFYESQLGLLASNSNLTQEKDCVDVYYLAHFYSEDVRGVTVRPNGQPEGYRGRPPVRPVVVLNALQADVTTLAHELGHALLDDGKHEGDGANLMAAGASRTGADLSGSQVTKIKQSQYVKG